ncbi:hypothetical protein ABXS75_17630 [Roseburia hominis]
MHVKAKKIAFGGLMLALTEICIALGSVLEMNTLFLLAAASFFVGIMLRETGVGTGAAFYLAGVLLGILISPNKLYVVSYAAMGFYILAIELVYRKLGTMKGNVNRQALFWTAKYLIFNCMFLPGILLFQKLLFARELSVVMLAVICASGQIGLLLYDRAYEFVQGNIWNKMRGRLLG